MTERLILAAVREALNNPHENRELIKSLVQMLSIIYEEILTPPGTWVSVDDRLPPASETCYLLACQAHDSNRKFHALSHRDDRGYWRGIHYDLQVTHWTVPPALPRDKD